MVFPLTTVDPRPSFFNAVAPRTFFSHVFPRLLRGIQSFATSFTGSRGQAAGRRAIKRSRGKTWGKTSRGSMWGKTSRGTTVVILLMTLLLTSCGFHLQGALPLAPPLKRLYLQSPDPYGYLVRTLQQYLKMSQVDLVGSPNEATTILVILRDSNTQDFVGVNGTQQTRQYNLNVIVDFEITDNAGRVILPPQSFKETRSITVQANQILGSSNEAGMLYQQMRRTLAYAIMNRIASKEVTQLINHSVSSKK